MTEIVVLLLDCFINTPLKWQRWRSLVTWTMHKFEVWVYKLVRPRNPLSFFRWWLILLDVYLKFWIHQNDRNGRITNTIYDWLSMIHNLVGVMITTIPFFRFSTAHDVSSNRLGFTTIQEKTKIVSESLSQELSCGWRGSSEFVIVLKWHRF